MNISEFVTKYNKVEGSSYACEENIKMPSTGVYEAKLQHDNADDDTIQVWTGPQGTGTKLAYQLTTPPDMPWKRIIHIETDQPNVYIIYQSAGDQVEAEDINEIYEALKETQRYVNLLAEEVIGGASAYTWNRLMGISDQNAINITIPAHDVYCQIGERPTMSIGAEGVDLTYTWQYHYDYTTAWTTWGTGNPFTPTGAATQTWDGMSIRCIVKDQEGNVAVSNTATLYITSD